MRLRHLALLCSVGFFAACGQSGAASRTEISLTIGDGLGAQPGEPAFEADRVDYRVTCAGTTPGSQSIPPSGGGGAVTYDDAVDISGSFEILDNSNPPVWQTIAALPPGPCTASLTVYRTGQVVCLGAEAFTVSEDATTQVNIVLLCELSIGVPDGSADADGDLQFEIGNECPKLFDFSTIDAVPGQESVLLSVVAQDIDGTCGSRCDPQSCTNDNPPICTPGPDVGLSTTLSAPVGSFDDPNGSVVTYTCDLDHPGPVRVCVTVTDGDLDCEKRECLFVDCPDRCNGVVCDDGNECTYDFCDPSTGACVFDPAPDGVACNACANTCSGGQCIGTEFVGTQSASIMPFQGVFRFVNATYINPYSDFFIFVPTTEVFYNTATYEGVSTFDAITGTPSGDYLFVSDRRFVAEQTLCGVERFLAGTAGDFAHLANRYINLIDMQLLGQLGDDVLWANSGDDFLDGAGGDDILDGGPGNDVILGGNGTDLITMGFDNGVDSVFGGPGFDEMSINTPASRITVLPAADPTYEFDIYYRSTWIAEITEVEQLNAVDVSIDLTACVAGVCDLCGDGVLNGGEQCDDGNVVAGDGCAPDCTDE